MALPALTLEVSPVQSFTQQDSASFLTALKAAFDHADITHMVVTASDVTADGYVEVRGKAAGPVPTARWLFGAVEPTTGTAPHNNNCASPDTGAAGFVYMACAPDADTTGPDNTWNNTTPSDVYTSRNLGLKKIIQLDHGTAIYRVDRLQVLCTEEFVVLMAWQDATVTSNWYSVSGAWLEPATAAQGESDGRLWLQGGGGTAMSTNFWGTSTSHLGGASVADGSWWVQCFDPEAPTTTLELERTPSNQVPANVGNFRAQSGELLAVPVHFAMEKTPYRYMGRTRGLGVSDYAVGSQIHRSSASGAIEALLFGYSRSAVGQVIAHVPT